MPYLLCIHINITLTLQLVDLKIKHYHTCMYIFTQILDKQHKELAQDHTYPASYE